MAQLSKSQEQKIRDLLTKAIPQAVEYSTEQRDSEVHNKLPDVPIYQVGKRGPIWIAVCHVKDGQKVDKLFFGFSKGAAMRRMWKWALV